MSEKFIQASYHGGPGNLPIIRLVIHATCPGMHYPRASAAGEAVNTAHYFAGSGPGGSAHHVADIAESVRCLTDNTIGYHAPPNAHSLGYEIGGESTYTREQWLSPQVWPAVERVAAQVKADAVRYGIPLRRLSVAQVAANSHGICGHVDVSQAFHQSDHTDPGPNFPWDTFMALLVGVKPVKPSLATRIRVAVATRRAKPPAAPSWYHRSLSYTPGQPYVHGTDVQHVQNRLVATGYLPARNAKGDANTDGFYGPSTKAAVQACQHHFHLNADGVVGPDTARAIG